MKKTGLVISIALAVCSLFTAIAGCALGGWLIVGTAKRNGWLGAGAAEPVIALEETPAPQETPAPAAARAADRVEVEIVCGEDGNDQYGNTLRHAQVRGYAGAELLWTREFAPFPVTELDAFNGIYLFEDLYLCCNDGTLMALDACTGDTVWENDDFGGSVSGFDLDEHRNIYLTGWYGPDFFLADIEGNTLCRIGEFDPDYYWANGVRKLDDHTAEVTLTMGPDGVEGEFRFRVEEDDGVWSWSGPEGAQTASSADERAWKTAYARFMEIQGRYDSYSLLDVGLDVPLLYMNGMTTAQGDLLCYYDAERDAYSTFDLWVDGLCYMPGLNLLWEQGGHMDVYYDKILTVRNGLIICWEAGEYGAVDNSHPETYVYSWNGRAMSEEEYWRALQDAFPMEAAQYADTEACSYEEMLARLNHDIS